MFLSTKWFIRAFHLDVDAVGTKVPQEPRPILELKADLDIHLAHEYPSVGPRQKRRVCCAAAASSARQN